jgi:hypothetical protein
MRFELSSMYKERERRQGIRLKGKEGRNKEKGRK